MCVADRTCGRPGRSEGVRFPATFAVLAALVAFGAPAVGRDDATPSRLQSLAALQHDDGDWPGSAEEGADSVSTTSLAVLAFLDSGYTHRGPSAPERAVAGGLRVLRAAQEPSGRFGAAGTSSLRRDALATAALVEAYGMTDSKVLVAPAQRALDALIASGGTRAPGVQATLPELDAFGWSAHAVASAREIARYFEARGRASLRVPTDALSSARAWLDDPRVLALREPSLVATRIHVRSAIGSGVRDLDRLRADLALVARATTVSLSARTVALARLGSTRAGARDAVAFRPVADAWLGAAPEPPPRSEAARVIRLAYAALAEPLFCTAYLPPFPGTGDAPPR
jgi:hypothetical protein